MSGSGLLLTLCFCGGLPRTDLVGLLQGDGDLEEETEDVDTTGETKGKVVGIG